MDAVYIDEKGQRVDPSAVGTTHEVVSEATKTSPQVPQQNIYGKLVQEERVSNFISQTSPYQSLSQIDYMLRGYIYNATEQEWKKISAGIPDNMRLDVLQFIAPILSENTRMTNFSIEQINGIINFIIEWTLDYLDNEADEEGLEEHQLSKIALIIWNAVIPTLFRAQDGMESRRMFKSLSMGDNLSASHQPQQNKDWWKFWK